MTVEKPLSSIMDNSIDSFLLSPPINGIDLESEAFDD